MIHCLTEGLGRVITPPKRGRVINPPPPQGGGGGRFGQMGGSKKRHIFGCSPPMMGGEQPKKSGFLAENGVLGKLRHFFPHHGGGQNFGPPILPHIFFSCLHFPKSYRTFFFWFAFPKTLPHIFFKVAPPHHGGGTSPMIR